MRQTLLQTLAILALALLPAAASGVWHPRRPAAQSDEVTLSTAQAWGGGVLWIDARPEPDFAEAHIPKALPLNEDGWERLLPEVLDHWDASRKTVVYCSSLSCQTSREVARRLRDQLALPNVFVLEGGWEAWQHRSRP